MKYIQETQPIYGCVFLFIFSYMDLFLSWFPMLNSHGKPNAAELPCQTYMGNQTLLDYLVKLTWESKRC